MRYWVEQLLGISYPVLWRLKLLLFVPWILLLLLGFWAIPHFEDYLKEVIGFVLFTTLMFAVVLGVNKASWRKWSSVLAAVVLYFFFFFKLTFYWQYNTKVSISAMFVIFETNGSEASDFLSNYIDWRAILLVIIGVLYVLVLVKFLWRNSLSEPITKSQKKFWPVARLLIIGAILGICFYGIHWKFQDENIPYTVASSFGEYKQTKELLKDQLAQARGQDAAVRSYASETATYVVVIGESTTRRNLQLYGYDRETNPKLTQIKGELLIFDSIISPHVHTITAMDKIMTLQNFENPKVDPNVSVVQLANQAGFKNLLVV